MTEQRKYHACREHVEKLIQAGWAITGRDPLRLEMGRRAVIVRGGCVIDGRG